MGRPLSFCVLLVTLLCVSASVATAAPRQLQQEQQWIHPTQLYKGDRKEAATRALAAAIASIQKTESENLTDKKTTLVLPVTKRDFERFLVLLASLHRFLDANIVSEMILVVRGDEVPAWKQMADLPSPFPIRVVGEETLVDLKFNKYRLQMMLKLLVSEQVQTKYYFVLDADLILRKPFSRKELLCDDGRAPYNPEPVYVHRDWWQASYNVLTMDTPKCMEVAAFGVTPAILTTAISRSVVHWMDAIFGRYWVKHFQYGDPVHNGLWTEYTMYALVGCATGAFERYHKCERIYYTGIWRQQEVHHGAAELWQYLVKTQPTDPPFVVLQEEAGVPLRDVVEAAKLMLADAIKNKKGGTQPVLAKLLDTAAMSVTQQQAQPAGRRRLRQRL